MASGFFLGGMAPGISQGANAISQDMQLSALVNLQVAQQQQNQKHADYMKLRSDLVSHIGNTITQLKNAHPSWTDLQVASSPAVVGLKNTLSGFDKNLKLPDTADSIIAGLVAGPSEIQTARMKAEATGEAGLRQSEVQKNQAATQNYRANAGLPVSDNNNPDRPGLPQNGPALGDKTAQAAQVDAPKVLSWGDARASVAQKYSPEIATKAELWLKGNTSVVTGLRGGRGGEREKIQNAAMDLANLTGMTPDQINQNFIQYKGQQAASTAGGRTAGSREANLGIILTAADSAIDAAITASNNVDRSNFVPLNRAQQTGQAAISDPKLKVFQQKNLQLADLWAKSFNPTGALRIDDRNLALDVLNTAIGKGTYETAANAIRDSIGLERGAAIKFLKSKGFTSGDTSTQGESSGAEPGPGGLTVHGFTFTPTGQ